MTDLAPSTLSPDDELSGIARRTARSAVAMFAAKSVRFVFLALVNLILINLLLPEDFGMVRYVTLIVGIANLLNEMGLITAIVQKERLEYESLWSFFLISSGWGAALYLAIFMMAPNLSRYFAAPELTSLLRVGALIIPAAGLSAVHRAWLRRRMEYGRLAAAETGAAVFSAAVSLTLAFAGFGVWALVAGNLLFEATVSAIMLASVKVSASRIVPYSAMRGVLFFGMAIVVSRLVDYVLSNAPLFLVGKAIGPGGLGLFGVAYDCALFPQMALNATLNQVLLSTFSRMQNDDGKTASGLTRMLSVGSILTVPLLLVMCIMPLEFLQVISAVRRNGEWLPAAPLLRYLAAAGIMYALSTFSGPLWVSRGKIGASIRFSAAMCLTVIVAIAGGVHWGAEGISVALFLRSVVVFPIFVYVNYRLTRVPMASYYGALLPSVAAGSGMAAALWFTGNVLPGNSLARHFAVLFGGTVLGTAVYGSILFLFFRSSLRQLVETARMLLPES